MKGYSENLRRKMLVPLMLPAIMLVALLLRVLQLDAESLWLDEATSVYLGDHNLIQILRLSFPDRNPPLYYLLLHYWMQLFGDSEFSVRLPSVLFGVFSVAMLYKVGTLLFDKWTGLISAFILTISAYQIHYSQEARAYSMMVFLALISFYLFLKLFEGKNYRTLAGYVLASTALMYTHYHSLFLVFAQALFVLGFYALRRHKPNATTYRTWANAPAFRTWALAAGAIVFLYIPGFFFLAYPLAHNRNPGFPQIPELIDVSNSFFQYAGAPDSPSPLLLAMLLLFALIAVRALVKKGKERAALSLLLLWLIIPVALPFLLSHVITPLYLPRYSIATLPALYLLVAVGMQKEGSVAMSTSTNCPVSLAALAITATPFIITGVLSLGILHDYFTTVKKEPWRDVSNYVKAYARPGDTLVISQAFMSVPYNYYARENDRPDSVIPLGPEEVNDVGYRVEGADRVWLLLSHLNEEPQKQFKAELEDAGFKVAAHKRYKGIDLTLLKKE